VSNRGSSVRQSGNESGCSGDRKAQFKGLKMVYYHSTTYPECKWQHTFSQASTFFQLSLNFSIIGGLLINLSAKSSECAMLCAVFVLCCSGASCTCTCSIWTLLHEASPAKVIPSQAPLPCNPCHCKHSPLAKQCCSSQPTGAATRSTVPCQVNFDREVHVCQQVDSRACTVCYRLVLWCIVGDGFD
jgi:hypothetical protein